MTLLGVDIGTTCVKACAYGEDGRFLGAAHRSTPTSRLQGSGAEYDARAVERAVFEVIRQVAERFGPPRAIRVASMAESGFLLDGSGEPLAPAVAWFDGRTAPQAARWKERLDPLDLFTRTGLHLVPRCSACKLEWHRENTPEAWSKAAPSSSKGTFEAIRGIAPRLEARGHGPSHRAKAKSAISGFATWLVEEKDSCAATPCEVEVPASQVLSPSLARLALRAEEPRRAGRGLEERGDRVSDVSWLKTEDCHVGPKSAG